MQYEQLCLARQGALDYPSMEAGQVQTPEAAKFLRRPPLIRTRYHPRHPPAAGIFCHPQHCTPLSARASARPGYRRSEGQAYPRARCE
jgi:hypothetical protein